MLSVRPSVRPSVCLSVRPIIRPLRAGGRKVGGANVRSRNVLRTNRAVTASCNWVDLLMSVQLM